MCPLSFQAIFWNRNHCDFLQINFFDPRAFELHCLNMMKISIRLAQSVLEVASSAKVFVRGTVQKAEVGAANVYHLAELLHEIRP